jgi:hypothetical protein
LYLQLIGKKGLACHTRSSVARVSRERPRLCFELKNDPLFFPKTFFWGFFFFPQRKRLRSNIEFLLRKTRKKHKTKVLLRSFHFWVRNSPGGGVLWFFSAHRKQIIPRMKNLGRNRKKTTKKNI